MSANKQKGTAAETAVVNVLRMNGFPLAERAPLYGAVDGGDITGTIGLAWEVRNRREIALQAWLKDSQSRAAARRADFGILVVKPQGSGYPSAGDWLAGMPLIELCDLLTKAGYGTPALLDREGSLVNGID